MISNIATVTITDTRGGGAECFIATVGYDSEMEPNVDVFREFRDCFLLKNSAGIKFVEFYYRYSPPVANLISQHKFLCLLVRWSLLPLVGISWISLKLGILPTVALIVLVMVLISSVVIVFLKKINLV